MNPALHAVLLGTAIGDSLGLPAENLSPQKIQRRWPGSLSQRFVFGRGMVSDDTEHTVFVAQCLAEKPTDAQGFQRMLAWKLRWWLLCAPAGIGFATLRAILKLWLGFSPARSGVYSAGNGPAMRSALIGAYFAGDLPHIREYVRASTRLTHTDPKAETAALAVAFTASWSITAGESTASRITEIRDLWQSAASVDANWLSLVEKIIDCRERKLSTQDFARELGLVYGVTGYSYHTVPVALFAWLTHFGNFRSGLESVIACGGDTDTVGAIAGALLAINSPIPTDWSERLCDYPISQRYLEDLALFLESETIQAPAFNWLALPFRNLAFLIVVLAHVGRRLLPV